MPHLMLDTGNTGFMLLCSSLVMLMTPGLAFFYGGLVGRKNVLAIMIQSFVSMGWTTVIWFAVGYSLCFSGGSGAIIGNLDKAFLKELKGSSVQVCSIRPGINVTEHLLHGSEHLDPARWEKTKKVFNILGDKPETTTPWIAERILATNKNGTRIAWLTTPKIAWRFTAAPFRKRDLFA